MRMHMPRPVAVASSGLTVIVAMLSGCSGGNEVAANPSSQPAAEGVEAAQFRPGKASDIGFWSSFQRGEGGVPVEQQDTLKELSVEATVTIAGRVVDTYPTRYVGETEGFPGSGVQFWGIEVAVDEVLAGELAPDAIGPDKVVIEVSREPSKEFATTPAIFFLRNTAWGSPLLYSKAPSKEDGKYYIFLGSNGLVVADTQGDALLAEGPLTAGEKVEGQPMDQVADAVRNYGKEWVLPTPPVVETS